MGGLKARSRYIHAGCLSPDQVRLMQKKPAKAPSRKLQHLLAVSTAAMPNDKALEHAGLLIDFSSNEQSSQGLDHAFEILDELQGRTLSPDHAPLVNYFRANAWAGKAQIRKDPDIWAWEQPEHEAQILELRRAITHKHFHKLHKVRRCQILTNLANNFSLIGRFVEAVETWDRALGVDAKFGMACGNRGAGLTHYAQALYDPGQASYMLIAAHDSLANALADDAFYESSGYKFDCARFQKKKRQIAALGDIAAIREHMKTHHYSLGRSAGEKRYRMWCLRKRLFIHPLNDLGPSPIAARDILTLPSIRESSPATAVTPPAIIGFFNQMKQEFVSARYLYYEGVHAERVHFADRDVLLYNTLDYPAYSLGAEKIRAAFRMAYSLFDKIGFFLNHYFALGHKPRHVSFRSVWYQAKGSRPQPLLQQFATCRNWPLRGLFWLSKDLFEEDFRSVTEPDAAALSEIRNHLEHKYLQLHLEGPPMTDDFTDPNAAKLRYAMTTYDFEAKTLRLLKLARAALIYLSIAVHCEETLRAQGADSDRPVIPVPLDPWRDEWKQ